MRYHNTTWNTGHVMHHDTDVNLDPAAVPMIRKLLDAGSGPVPFISPGWLYRLTTEDDIAVLSVAYESAPVWITLGYATAEAASDADAQLTQVSDITNVRRCCGRLQAPGLCTMFLPSAPSDALPEDVKTLSDFAKSLISVWLLDWCGEA